MRARNIATLIAAALACTLAACATAPEGEAPSGAPVTDRGQAGKPGARPGQQGQAQPVTPGGIGGTGLAPGTDPSKDGPLARRDVYFDYDRFDIKDEYRPMIEAHAKFLRGRPKARVLIQGHADERGSREYNVGLGQRRSESVKRMLTLLGASERQVEAVSLGEEKPVCTEDSESCWSRNRRAHLLYGGEF